MADESGMRRLRDVVPRVNPRQILLRYFVGRINDTQIDRFDRIAIHRFRCFSLWP
jgi:hypothetical protein